MVGGGNLQIQWKQYPQQIWVGFIFQFLWISHAQLPNVRLPTEASENGRSRIVKGKEKVIHYVEKWQFIYCFFAVVNFCCGKIPSSQYFYRIGRSKMDSVKNQILDNYILGFMFDSISLNCISPLLRVLYPIHYYLFFEMCKGFTENIWLQNVWRIYVYIK